MGEAFLTQRLSTTYTLTFWLYHVEEFAGFARTKLTMPMLVLSGEKAGGPFLIEQGRMVATNVEGVLIKGRGHWLMEEAPDEVMPKLVEFLNR